MNIPERRPWSALLLAAGGSSRLGQAKQLVPIKGVPLVRHVAERILNCQPDQLIVVTGSNSDAVVAALEGLPVQICHNPEWSLGMGHSIARGAADIALRAEAVMLLTCDQWALEKSDYLALLDARTRDISEITVSQWKENDSLVQGPPAVFERKYIPELEELKGDEGARTIVRRNSTRVRQVLLPRARPDLDRPEQLDELPV